MTNMPRNWEVSFGNACLPCRSEVDAKVLARELIKKGHRVTAQCVANDASARKIDPPHIAGWLAE